MIFVWARGPAWIGKSKPYPPPDLGNPAGDEDHV